MQQWLLTCFATKSFAAKSFATKSFASKNFATNWFDNVCIISKWRVNDESENKFFDNDHKKDDFVKAQREEK